MAVLHEPEIKSIKSNNGSSRLNKTKFNSLTSASNLLLKKKNESQELQVPLKMQIEDKKQNKPSLLKTQKIQQ